MKQLLYDELVSWYHLLDPVEDHEEEAKLYRDELLGAAGADAAGVGAETLLELGAGAGHNAFYLKKDFRCTLTDVSAPMQARSRSLNPECEHLIGDMRTMRLDREFDVVLVHDAIVYMTTEDDLAAAIQTAFIHTRSGGAALFTPDFIQENFRENTLLHTGAKDDRSMRCMEYSWDPDATDTSYVADMVFLLREGNEVRAVHDRHIAGLFSRATWERLLRGAGFDARVAHRPLGDGITDEVFVCSKP